MNDKSKTRQRLLIFHFFTGQLPLFILFGLLVMKNVLPLQGLWYALIGLYVINVLIINFYFMSELKKFAKQNDIQSNMYLQQQVFIALFSIIGIVGLYRGLFAGEIYQKIIGFVGFIVAIIFIILLVWGLHYLKDIKRKNR
ncbi:TPA: hypothetical protein U1B35_000309 [Streptococcus suis]|uniref:Membrane protein n=1 Tax=Streptococcus suis TaxID=1307 RepID=A0A0Z8HPX7_STRSU|nr:hypothetical protein [Streptococcus suis]MCK4005040.1 hypothetical protein [Streptococcus suis]MCO8180159.1 hypothetical protein [Streptococcus suis]MCQ9223897.1 hypothetical protein [Streptococcus suis]MCQ9230586.1 hypothetical protein [Streptococcus suis]MCR1231907.1 hypothetical protein [Streptococcus suis]